MKNKLSEIYRIQRPFRSPAILAGRRLRRLLYRTLSLHTAGISGCSANGLFGRNP